MNLYTLACPECKSEQITADVLRHDWMYFECANCDAEGEGPINTLADRLDNIGEAILQQRTQWRKESAIRRNKGRN
jgi:hypothetical protein